MKKFEANCLEKVYELATAEYNCSITQLDIEIIQQPSKGFLGFGKKNAIIQVCFKDKCKVYVQETKIFRNKDVQIQEVSERIEYSHKKEEKHNLQKEEKLELLKRLSIEKESTSFTDFWVWFRKNCAMNFAKQFSKHLYPTDDAYAQRNYNQMRASKSHPFWNHIKARIYKMWCSIITEKQCIQSLYQYIQESKKDWKIYLHFQL